MNPAQKRVDLAHSLEMLSREIARSEDLSREFQSLLEQYQRLQAACAGLAIDSPPKSLDTLGLT